MLAVSCRFLPFANGKKRPFLLWFEYSRWSVLKILTDNEIRYCQIVVVAVGMELYPIHVSGIVRLVCGV
jgi:hypothetical protein